MMSMNSDEVFDAIEEVAQAKGKQKEVVIKNYIDDVLFQAVLKLALHPIHTFGMASIPKYDVCGEEETHCGETFEVSDMMLLAAMRERRMTGAEAQDAVRIAFERLSYKSAELMKRIITRDLRAGFTANTVNKVAKGTFPTFPYMRCSLPSKVKIEEWDWGSGIFSQEKADGMFANVNVEESGNIEISSRQGSSFPIEEFYSFVAEARRRLEANKQYHGEFLVTEDGAILPRELSNGVMNRILKGGQFKESESLLYLIWDSIPLDSVKPKGKFTASYELRFDRIIRLLNKTRGIYIDVVPTQIVYSLEEAYEHYRELLHEGKEGTIIKQRDMIWKDGTSKGQIKLKLEVDVDLVVTGFLAGKGKNESTFGSIVVQTADGDLEVAVSGFKDAERKKIWADKDDYIGKIMAVRSNTVLNPSKSNDLHSLFLPRFIEFRNDKDEADTLQMVKDQFESAIRNV